MTLYDRIKKMTLEQMAEDRVSSRSKITCHSNADNWDYYDYWYETSDGKHFTASTIGKSEAIKHEIEILSREY